MTTPAFLRRFPSKAVLSDGAEVTVRPLTPEDKTELLRFFLRVSEEDRFYLNNNVTAPETIREFTDGIDLELTVPLVAMAGEKIVADATLHRSKRAARRHVGELRLVVDPEYRGQGLGSRMIHELIQVGRDLELRSLSFELVDRREQRAIQAALAAGFEEVAILRGRVRDMYGSLQDLVVLELSLDEEALSHLDF